MGEVVPEGAEAFLLWRVRMPSLIASATPCRYPSSKARSMSWPVARERWAMAPRVCRRAISLKVWAAAAWVGELGHLYGEAEAPI